ncbi:MAG: MBL fold metallo-hydrolase [Bacteroidetes bacterium]|nr:MAG: MBL fold metallo-hydrolase [Bacteroidota bacterium]
MVVVDTQYPDTAEACWSGLRERTTRPLDLLVNTHHHGDHTGGNGVLQPHARQHVAHRNVPALQRQAAAQRGTDTEPTVPTLGYEETWEQDLGDETIRLRHYGPAHTGGDSVVHFVQADVVHMGDLVFNRMPPFVDGPGGASVRGWIDTLEQVHAAFSDETIFIFGHAGEGHAITGPRADLLAMRDFLDGLLAFAQAALDAGQTEDELARTQRLPDFPTYYRDSWPEAIPIALRVAYRELRGDP